MTRGGQLHGGRKDSRVFLPAASAIHYLKEVGP